MTETIQTIKTVMETIKSVLGKIEKALKRIARMIHQPDQAPHFKWVSVLGRPYFVYRRPRICARSDC